MWSAPPPPLSFNDDDGSVPLLRPPQLPQNGINISGGNGNSGVPSAEDFFPPSSSLSGGQLSKKVINMKELRSLALQSLSNSPGIRSTIWKLLLGYLPPKRSLWSTELKQKRPQYKHYKDELLTTSELNNTPLRAERSQEAIVYVGNPDPQLSEEFLWECLIQAGDVGKLNALVHMNNLRLVAYVSYGCWLYLEELVDFLCEEDIGYAIKVLNMIKLYGKPIRVNKYASQDKKIIDVGCLWKQLKQWLIFTLLPKAAH
ncbi:hypothetical protein HID58_052013 [Brassica napus]|uniref:(rape) hypothetical protein n=1 Tax=Brassica napus TaxID=3708 RepID=A0A816I4R0_BRANA|nr:hypothetical protein HID58_052013 [Brassica napus]CAF1700256.1 unnamed protein product [Brassica napus]